MKAESIYIIHRNPSDNNRWTCQLYGMGIAFSFMERAEQEMTLLLGEDCFSFYGQLSEAQAIAKALNEEHITEKDCEKATALLIAYQDAKTANDRLAHHILQVTEDLAKSDSEGRTLYAGALVFMAGRRKYLAKQSA